MNYVARESTLRLLIIFLSRHTLQLGSKEFFFLFFFFSSFLFTRETPVRFLREVRRLSTTSLSLSPIRGNSKNQRFLNEMFRDNEVLGKQVPIKFQMFFSISSSCPFLFLPYLCRMFQKSHQSNSAVRNENNVALGASFSRKSVEGLFHYYYLPVNTFQQTERNNLEEKITKSHHVVHLIA